MIPADSLRDVQLLNIEIGEGCNLADRHGLCPAHVGDRWRGARDGAPLTDAEIVALAVEAYERLGFRGLVGWHYYCEPLLYRERVVRLCRAIRERVAAARFALWTNGTLVGDDASDLAVFDRAWCSCYGGAAVPAALKRAVPDTVALPGVLDSRLSARADSAAPCWRPFAEFAIDARGYAHLCCVAYHGDETLGNVHSEPLADIAERFNGIRRRLAIAADDRAPAVCRSCGSRMCEVPALDDRVAVVALVRDEADILPQWWAHHAALADLVIITDNGSVDGTREFLAERERDPHVIVIDEPSRAYDQGAWTTRMLDLARAHGCRWIVPADADEFWCPAGGREGLRSLLWRHRRERVLYQASYLYRATERDDDGERDPLRRIQYREQAPHPWWAKVMVRTDWGTRVELGNHHAQDGAGARLRGPALTPEESLIRHYASRGWHHWRTKVIRGGEMYEKHTPAGLHGARVGFHWREPYHEYEARGLAGLWRWWQEKERANASELVHDSFGVKS